MKTLAGALAVAVTALASAAPAGAQTPATFSCTASAVTSQVGTSPVLNPITAGADGQPCVQGITGLPNTGEALLFGALKAETAYALVDPGGNVPATSTPRAAAGIEGLSIGEGNASIMVDAARSQITASCVNGAPVFTPTSTVAKITIAGTPIELDGPLTQITDALSAALGQIVEIKLNEVVDIPGGGKAVRAARITLLKGTPAQIQVIVAESRLATNGDVCSPYNIPTGPVTPPPPQTSAQGCPAGSVYDPVHNVCILPVPGSQTPNNPAGDLGGPGSVIVNQPGQGPVGGTVITLQEARKQFPTSPCIKGGGSLFVIKGTNRKDKITGTNKRDRILGLKGQDRLDSGKARDCVDGGKGRDGMTGGQQGDRLYGRNGRDFLNGDAGTDHLYGGAGSDYINAAYGADRVFGGGGNDKMNVATAGKRARVSGGAGLDKVRCNPGDLRSIRKDVEKVIVTRKIKG